MNRYVFTESKKYIEVIVTIAVVVFVVYSARRTPTVAALVGLVVLLFSCTTIREILFMEKELIITNDYGMKFHIPYDEIKCFDKGWGTDVLTIIAFKKKFIPIFFASRMGLRSKIGEILARLEAATGRTAGTIFESKKSTRPATATHENTQGLNVTNDGKSETDVMTRPMSYLAKAVRVLSKVFMVCCVVIFGLSILIKMHELPTTLKNSLEHCLSLSYLILYGIIIILSVAAVYVKLIRHHIIKPKLKSQRNDTSEGN